jgi:RHS repeat-associated protein
VTDTESGIPLCDGGSSGRWLTHNYYHADGNGNITCLVDANQTLVASYRYDPFGNTLSQSGGLANANTYRFSSKEFHAASGLYYYGYRFYDPSLQRWINRDPTTDQGFVATKSRRSHFLRFVPLAERMQGPNAYLFVLNSPTVYSDPRGLEVLNYGCSGGQPTCWSPLQPGPPPPQPDPCTARGGHNEPYWKVMGYSDLQTCATKEWQLIRDSTAAGLGAIAGGLCGGTIGGGLGAIGGGILIPTLICAQPICVFN